MGNEKLLLYKFQELKEKIIRFFFSYNYFGGSGSIDLIKDDLKIICKYNPYADLGEDEDVIKYIFPMEKWNEFVNKVLNENILRWEKRYENRIIALDGEEWKLKMEFIDLQEFESSGYNEYPYNWKNIRKIINEYFPKMDDNI
jgi:hypothetical protein